MNPKVGQPQEGSLQIKFINIINFLSLFKSKIESQNPIEKIYLESKGNQNGFEKLVPEIAEEIKKEINNEKIFDYIVHLGHHFPDLDLLINEQRFGLELKSRNNGTWDTLGNSIFESITSTNYLLFGSKEPEADHILVKYEEY